MSRILKSSILSLLTVVTLHNNAYASKNQYVECPPISKIVITEDGKNTLFTSRYAEKFSGYAPKGTLAALDALKIIKIDPRAYRIVCQYSTTEKQQVNLVLEKTFDECTQKDAQSAVCTD